MDDKSDEDLLEAYYNCSDAAFKELSLRHEARMIGHANRSMAKKGICAGDCADVAAQDTLFKIIKTKSTPNGVAKYSEGTLSTTAGNATIVGSGTDWTPKMAGWHLFIAGSREPLVIRSAEATSLTVETVPAETITGASYCIKNLIRWQRERGKKVSAWMNGILGREVVNCLRERNRRIGGRRVGPFPDSRDDEAPAWEPQDENAVEPIDDLVAEEEGETLKDQNKKVSACVEKLDEPKRTIVRRKHGFDGECRTNREIARELNLTDVQIYRHLDKALKVIAACLGETLDEEGDQP